MLVDKDNKPNWRFKSVGEIDVYKHAHKFFDRQEMINVDPNVENENENENQK